MTNLTQSQTSGARRAALAAALAAVGTACATIPPVQLGFELGQNGAVLSRPFPCSGDAATQPPRTAAQGLPGPLLRVLSWNVHKNADPGWAADLARFAGESDLLLIQEAALTPGLQGQLADAGFDWLLAGSFARSGNETGVLNAARVRPLAGCVQRAFEPLLQLPKAALITRYAVDGIEGTLAVANVHAINFTLGLGEYRAQLAAIVGELAQHRGPVIVGGDFNSWSSERLQIVHDVLLPIGLVSVQPGVDRRSRFMGRQVDHLFVRGLEVVAGWVPEVESSDHNPVLATLRLPGGGT